MSYGIISGCNSLRKMCSGVISYENKISHYKFTSAPERSTLSGANTNRSYKVLESIYTSLV